MDRVGVIRFGLQNQPTKLLGGLEPAGLMVLNRKSECFGNRCHT
jgi:hypothetical protein